MERDCSGEENKGEAFMFPCYTSDSPVIIVTKILAKFSHILHKVMWFWLPTQRWGFSLLTVPVGRV